MDKNQRKQIITNIQQKVFNLEAALDKNSNPACAENLDAFLESLDLELDSWGELITNNIAPQAIPRQG